jgi:hypothetical protein
MLVVGTVTPAPPWVSVTVGQPLSAHARVPVLVSTTSEIAAPGSIGGWWTTRIVRFLALQGSTLAGGGGSGLGGRGEGFFTAERF